MGGMETALVPRKPLASKVHENWIVPVFRSGLTGSTTEKSHFPWILHAETVWALHPPLTPWISTNHALGPLALMVTSEASDVMGQSPDTRVSTSLYVPAI
jgi:hypothetical protein